MKNTMTEAQYLARLHEMWQKNWPQEAPRAPHYPFGERPLTDYLREWARRTPEKPALIFYGAELSYSELDRQATVSHCGSPRTARGKATGWPSFCQTARSST